MTWLVIAGLFGLGLALGVVAWAVSDLAAEVRGMREDLAAARGKASWAPLKQTRYEVVGERWAAPTRPIACPAPRVAPGVGQTVSCERGQVGR